MKTMEAQEIINEGVEIYGDKYHDAIETLEKEHRNDICPVELTKTMTFKYEGFECKIYYNYVPPFGGGAVPMNTWWGFGENKVGRFFSLQVEDEKFEDACKTIIPQFIKSIDSYKQE